MFKSVVIFRIYTEQLCHNLPQSEETAHVILTAPCCLILCFINCLLIV